MIQQCCTRKLTLWKRVQKAIFSVSFLMAACSYKSCYTTSVVLLKTVVEKVVSRSASPSVSEVVVCATTQKQNSILYLYNLHKMS